MKKTIDPQDIVAVVDTKEKRALNLSPLKSTRLNLTTGDYSVLGLTHEIAIERKSLDDLCMCVGRERERFDRECKRLLGYPTRAIVVESTWLEIQGGGWRSKVKPESVFGSLLGWIAMGVPVIMAGNHDQAGKFVSRMLFIAARRRWRELSTFFEARSRQ